MKRYAPLAALLVAVIFSSGCAVYETPPAYGHEPSPRVVVSAPEFLYVIPTFGVYFVPNISAEVFFVNGRWYYSARGVWYWGSSYRGPWTTIHVRHIPRQLRKLPRDYRTRYRTEYYKVPFGHWEKRRQALPPRARAKSKSTPRILMSSSTTATGTANTRGSGTRARAARGPGGTGITIIFPSP